MGDFSVRKIKGSQDKKRMYHHAINDIEAFELMLKEKMFDNGPAKIGAEQELCVVDQNGDPATSALKILDAIDDDDVAEDDDDDEDAEDEERELKKLQEQFKKKGRKAAAAAANTKKKAKGKSKK